MKKLFFITTLLLSMMLAPFVFAASLTQEAVGLHAYSIQPSIGYGLEIRSIDCASDVQPKMTVIYKTTAEVHSCYIIKLTSNLGGNQNRIFVNHKEAATLTDGIKPYDWQSANEDLLKNII